MRAYGLGGSEATWRRARAIQVSRVGVAVPFYQHWLHTDTLPMFRAMDAALAREAGDHGH